MNRSKPAIYERIIRHDQKEFIPRMQGQLNLKNIYQCHLLYETNEREKLYNNASKCRKIIQQNSTLIYGKSAQQAKTKLYLPKALNAHLQKTPKKQNPWLTLFLNVEDCILSAITQECPF